MNRYNLIQLLRFKNHGLKRLSISTSLTLLVVISLCLASCKSRQYSLQSVKPHRIQVTRALDEHPLQAAQDFIRLYTAGVDSLRRPYIGCSESYMAGGRPESLLSNWVSDALVATGERMGYRPDLGICNVGGLRAFMPKDTVRLGDILSISPFENYFTILKMRGSDVQQLMQDIAAVHGEGVNSSVRLVITRDGRLKSATLGGRPIREDSIYTIATIDYLADGNDKLYSLKKATERINTKELVREMLMNQLRWLDKQGLKASAHIEGRIIETDEGQVQQELQEKISSRGEAPIQVNANAYSSSRKLFLVHTNDTHSTIEPLSPLLADTVLADKGGYLRRAALLRELRREHPDLLLVDAGDFSQGSAYYSLYNGDVEVGLMNLMGYDAATIGNHEFDFGMENMARIFRKAQFPIVCCNYDFTGTPVEGLVRPYVIVKRAGLKIGILGVSPELEGLVAAHTCKGVRYSDPIESAQRVADYLRQNERCDLVICLSHLGWQEEGVSDEELIPATRNIDVVIGGHSHSYFTSPKLLRNADGVVVPDNQMGKHACYVGTLELKLTR